MLAVENLEVRYGGIMALRSVSIAVAEGETVLLIGANGAGKSSLINAIIGLATQGVEIDDIATTAKTLPQFAQLWQGMVGGISTTSRSSDPLNLF